MTKERIKKMLETKITEMLGIKYPIVQGGMAWIATAELVAAVSNAGGLGILGSIQYPTPERLREEIHKTRKLTDKPFGVNITLLPSMRELPNDGFVQVACEEKIPVVETTAGNPEKYIDILKKHNVKLIHKVGAIKHAKNAQKLGADAVAIVGFEGAGHPLMDDVSLWNIIPRAVDMLEIPVLAAGGSSDGRQLTAALALGASAIVVGTVFITAKECPAHPNFKQAMLNATECDTVLIQRSIQNQTRVFKNKNATAVLELEDRKATFEELIPLIKGEGGRRCLMDGEIDYGCITVGQGVGLIKEILSAREIIDNYVTGAQALIRRLDA
jgi:NADH:quinone reductase (non-electrogenic)